MEAPEKRDDTSVGRIMGESDETNGTPLEKGWEISGDPMDALLGTCEETTGNVKVTTLDEATHVTKTTNDTLLEKPKEATDKTNDTSLGSPMETPHEASDPSPSTNIKASGNAKPKTATSTPAKAASNAINEMQRPGKVSEADVVFTHASDRQRETLLRDRAKCECGPLATRDYIHIQGELDDMAFSQGRLEYYVLHWHQDPNDVLTSCSVKVRPAFINSSKGTKTVKVGVITDVFTRPDVRQKGLATVLLRKLQESMDSREGGWKIDFSVVYAHVYAPMFHRLGWREYDGSQLRIQVGNLKVACPPEEQVKALNWNDALAVAAEDRRLSRVRHSAIKDDKIHVQIAPSVEATKWHLVRDSYYNRILGKRYSDRVARCGASSIGDPRRDQPVAAWWVHDLVRRQLIVGKMVLARTAGLEENIAAVLQMALVEAEAWGLFEVVLWNPSEMVIRGARTLEEKLGAKVLHEARMDRLPSLRVHGGQTSHVTWHEMEYYAWC